MKKTLRVGSILDVKTDKHGTQRCEVIDIKGDLFTLRMFCEGLN